MDIKIHQVTASDDLFRIVQLIAEFAKHEGSSCLSEEELVSNLSKTLNLYEKFLRVYLIQEVVTTKHIGYAFCYITFSSFLGAPRLFIEDLFLRESYRGRGHGRGIFEFLVHEGQRLGCITLEWGCPLDNLSSIAFYEAMGGKPDKKFIFNLDLSE